MRPIASITVVLLAAVALAHAARVAFGVELIVGTSVIPMWPSVLGTLVPGGLAFLLWKESRRG